MLCFDVVLELLDCLPTPFGLWMTISYPIMTGSPAAREPGLVFILGVGISLHLTIWFNSIWVCHKYDFLWTQAMFPERKNKNKKSFWCNNQWQLAFQHIMELCISSHTKTWLLAYPLSFFFSIFLFFYCYSHILHYTTGIDFLIRNYWITRRKESISISNHSCHHIILV